MDSRASAVLHIRRSPLSLSISLAALGVLANLSSAQVFAACVPTGVSTVTCTGVTSTNHVSTTDGLTFNVDSGASISTAGNGTPIIELSGSNITVTNQGSIFSPSGTSRTTALKVGNSSAQNIVITNTEDGFIGGITENLSPSVPDLNGMALDIQAGAGGTITIVNDGIIFANGLSGSLLTADAPNVAIYGGARIEMTNTNSGHIDGRIALQASTEGNIFTNAGTLDGSLSLGAGAGNNRYNAITGSEVLIGDGIGTTSLTVDSNPNLLFVAPGTVDGGAGGANILALQNAIGGGSGSTGTGTISAANFINFRNLLMQSGTWQIDGALLTGASTSASLTGGVLSVNNDAVFGSGSISVDGGTLSADAATVSLANAVNVGAGGMTVVGSNTLALNGIVSGSSGGVLSQNGSGTLVLAGANTYAGGTALNAGTLVVGSDSALGSGALTAAAGTQLDSNRAATLGNAITLNGNLTVAGSNALTLNGALGGSGDLIKNGAASLTLSGVNSLTGNTTVNAGTLNVDGTLNSSNVQVNSGSTLGGSGILSGAVTVADGGHLALRTGSALTVGSLALGGNSNIDVGLGVPVSGGGSGLLNVNGNLTLDGTLNIANAGGIGTGVYRVINYSGSLTDNGLLFGSLPSGLTPGDVQVQTSIGNQINLLVAAPGITVQFWDGSQLSANGNIDGGTGVWNSSNTNWTNVDGAVNQAWSGNFAVFQGAAGTVTVNGTQSTNGMQFAVDGYRLQNGVEGALNLINGSLGNATVRVDPNATATLDVALTGSGTLGKYDSGTLVLNAANTYTGGTLLNGGTLVLGNNAALGNGSLTTAASSTLDNSAAFTLGNAVILDGALAIAGSNDLTLSGSISGSGSLSKNGSSTLIFNSDSSIGGGTLVNAGSLIVGDTAGSTANLASDVQVASGAVLGGHGAIAGQVNIASGATLKPGNSIGTLQVDGDVNLAAGSTLEVETNPDGRSDKLISTGTVNLTGAALNVLADTGSWGPSTSYGIIQAATVNGTFAGVSTNLAFLRPEVVYSPTDVILTLARNNVSFRSVARTSNQRAAAASIESAGAGTLFNTVAVLTAEQAQLAFDSLSGELHASTLGALFDESRYVRDVVSQRMQAAQTQTAMDGVLHADAETGITLWLQGYGGWGDNNGNSHTASIDHDSQGALLGIDLPVNEHWRVGAAVGYGSSDLDVDERNSSADIDSTSLTLFAAGQWDAINLRLGASRAWNDIDSSRHVQISGLSDHDKASYDATTTQVFGELGYAISVGEFTVEPFAGIAHVKVDSDSLEEDGGITALRSDDDQDSLTYGSLGVHATTALASVGSVPLALQGKLAWQHAFDDLDPERRMSFAAGNPFTVQGTPLAQDTALVRLGISAQVATSTTVDLGYSGQFGDGYKDNGVRLGLNISF